jgi:hypothetical protein
LRLERAYLAIARFSASAPSPHSLSSAGSTTYIAESNFRYTQQTGYSKPKRRAKFRGEHDEHKETH